jgi:hypothetical protein
MAWIRLDTDLEQDRKFRRLDGFGRALWPVLLRLCKKREGWIPAEDWDAYHFADLMRFAEFEEQIEKAMDTILEVGLMDHEGDRIVVRNWRNYQSTSAERMARKRAEEKANDYAKQVAHKSNGRNSAPQYSTLQDRDQTHACVSPSVYESDEQQDIEVQVETDKTSKSKRDEEIDLAFGNLGPRSRELANLICTLWPEYPTDRALGTVEKALPVITGNPKLDWKKVVRDACDSWGPGDPWLYGGENKLHKKLMAFFKNAEKFQKPEQTTDNRGMPHESRPRRIVDTSTNYQPANMSPEEIKQITASYKGRFMCAEAQEEDENGERE